jgi:hypothetical protein
MARTYIVLPPEPDPGGEKLDAWEYTGAGDETVNAEAAVLVDTEGRPLSEDRTASGTVDAGDDIVGPLDCAGMQTVLVSVTDVDSLNPFSGFLLIEGTLDGSTWLGLPFAPLDSQTLYTSITTAYTPGNPLVVAVGGWAQVRARADLVSANAATVLLRATAAATAAPQSVYGPLTDTQLRLAPVAVAGEFYPATQPVSGTVAVSNFPAAQPVTDNGGSLTVDGTVAVSGTVPVSGPLTDAQLRADAVPVSGTFWQATQPVSLAAAVPVTDNGGTLSVDDGGGSLTVDGTVELGATSLAALETVQVGNFPATQPVSGTFWQATQPVSGTVTANAGSGPFPVSDNGGSLTVDGSVSLAAAIPAGTNNIGDVDVLTLPALPAGNNNIGDVDVASLPSLPTGANTIGAVTQASGPWSTNVTQLQGAAPSATNPLPVRLTDGATYIGAKRTYRLTARSLSVAMGGTNATKTLVAIWHAAASAVRLELQRVILTFTSSAAGIVTAEIVRITTAPTGGTSVAANIVPNDSADAASVQSAMTLPSGEPTKTAPLVAASFNVGAAAAATNLANLTPIVLYTHDDQERKPLTAAGGALQGFGIQLFSTTNVTYIATVEVEFCEVG